MIKYDLQNLKNRIFFGCSTDVSEEIIGCIAVKKWEIFGFFTSASECARTDIMYLLIGEVKVAKKRD